MTTCPFQILGLDRSASIEDIDKQWRNLMLHAHPDKTDSQDDERAKCLNDARERARRMYHSYDFETARITREYEDKKRKREVFRVVQRIFKNHYEKACAMYSNGLNFEKEMQECSPDIRKEAEDIVQYGMGDSSKKLVAAEETIAKLENHIQTLERQLNQTNTRKRKQFQQDVANFIESEISIAEKTSFVLTQQLVASFEKFQGHGNYKQNLFAQELSRQLEEKFPCMIRGRNNLNARGYRGICLK